MVTAPEALASVTGRRAHGGDRPQVGLVPVELERAEAREGLVARAVEVRRTGAEDLELRGDLAQQVDLLAGIGRVERLDAIDAEPRETLEHRAYRCRILHVPERVRPDRNTPGAVDQLDRLAHRRA